MTFLLNNSCNKDEGIEPFSIDNPDFSQPNGVFRDRRDKKEYNWVRIGEQVWMAENLAFKAENGCWAYDNNEVNAEIYGYLYDMETSKEVAPEGWRLPTDDEWAQLMTYLKDNRYSYDGIIGNDYIGKALATDYGWEASTNEGAIGNSDYPEYRNKSGFSALPSGYAYRILPESEVQFECIGQTASWWFTPTNEESINYYVITLAYYRASETSPEFGGRIKAIRCIKD